MEKNITISKKEYLILIQTIEELKTELRHLKEHFVPVEKKNDPLLKSSATPITRLKGVISLPADFDYKGFIGEEILTSYMSK